MAGVGNMYEVELGKVATAKARSADVKKFGTQMVKDHAKANEELMAAGLEVPPKLHEKHEKHQKHLMFKDYTGDDFDAAYVKHMVEDYEEDVALFTRTSNELKSENSRRLLGRVPAAKDRSARALPSGLWHVRCYSLLCPGSTPGETR